MSAQRLSALDASFLQTETPAAHMHVGWAAVFDPPADGSDLPRFHQLRAHIAGRLHRAPRYTQKIELIPLGVHEPVWVDDHEFDLDHHLHHTISPDLDAVVDAVMSEPLRRDRPLWQMWVADRLADGRLAIVGKAHHCMVDGLAAVELGSLLLDLEPVSAPAGEGPADGRRREAEGGARLPDSLDLLADGLLDRLAEQARVAQASLRAFATPWSLPAATGRFARTLARAALPFAPASPFNRPSSPARRLVRVTRPLADLERVKRRFGTTINDVVLAVSAGCARGFISGRGEEPRALKAMVPVSVRGAGEAGRLGNRIAFMFVELPCDEPDPVVRLMRVHRETAARKSAGEPADADAALRAMGHAPRALRRAMAQMVASPRMFNLVVSNIPGPRVPLYLLGCRLQETWPVVPLAEGHALSIGMTTVCDRACFGLYVDRDALPDASGLARHVHEALDELIRAGAELGRPAVREAVPA